MLNFILLLSLSVELENSGWLEGVQNTKTSRATTFQKQSIFKCEIDSIDLPLNKILKNAKKESEEATKFVIEAQTEKPFDAIPRYKGSVKENVPLKFQSSVFGSLNLSLQINETKGMILEIHATNKSHAFGSEWIILMTSHRMAFHSLSKEGIHKITLKGWKNVTEILDVEANGVRIFTFDQKIGPLLKSAWRIMQLVKALSTSDEKTLKQFHQDQMNYTFTQRNDSIVLGLDDNKEDVNSIERRIRSGDLLACHILTGANTFGWYFYGTHISHIVMCLRDENDELFVVETTNANFFPDPQPPWGNGFRKTPFREWMTLYHSHGYAVSLLPLESSLSSSFNSTAAWEWFHSHEKAFSTTAFPFIAIDTPNNNIPTDFTRESLIFFLMLAGHVKPKVVSQHLIEAVNMRLFHIFDERPCHSIEECITTANKLGLDLFDIAAIPEDESWMYQDGPMLVCSTVVANMLRAGGVLGNITFNPTELTPKDILMLNIFDTNPAARISPRCVSTLPVVKPYCQLMGPYVMDVQYYNTITPHDHMFDNCGASPPDWKPYPEGC